MPADSRVTQSFPLEEEERDEPYRLSAERANSMNAAVIARISVIFRESFLVDAKNPTGRTARPEGWYEPIEQTSQPIKSWFSTHDYGSRRSG
jgi:hypothetical protein